MRKIISVCGVEYELATNAYTPIAYKKEFGKDYFQDLFNMVNTKAIMDKLADKGSDGELEASDIDMEILSNFDMTFANRLFWVFAKSANPHIRPFEQFFMEMEEFPVMDIMPVLFEMLEANMQTKKFRTNQNLQAMKSLQ
ncbi:TPA: hypothetical protein ACGO0F_001296 [Streptococcus suis]